MAKRKAMRAAVGVAVVTAIGLAIAWAAGSTAAGATTVAGLALPVTVLVALCAFIIQWLAFVPAYLKQTEHFYDLVGSFTYLSCTWLTVVLVGRYDSRTLMLATFVSIWALRLGSFLFRRIRKAGKDGRFDEIKPNAPRFLFAWSLQGLWVVVTLAALLAAVSSTPPAPLGILDGLGAALWVAGFAIEVVSDQQKSAFRAKHPGAFINSGLWSWSQHPNYFGEIMLWTGVAVSAAATLRGWQWVSLVSPLFVTLLLTRISGIPMLDKRATERYGQDPAWQRYRATTNVLIPWPPSREQLSDDTAQLSRPTKRETAAANAPAGWTAGG